MVDLVRVRMCQLWPRETNLDLVLDTARNANRSEAVEKSLRGHASW